MGVSSSKKVIKDFPLDQYVCTSCDQVPKIINLDFNNGMLEFECKEHPKVHIEIREYFKKESEHLYYNLKCFHDNKLQKDCLPSIFKKDIKEKKIFCQSCSQSKKQNLIKVNELSNKCHVHNQKYIKYCEKCDKHFCENDIIECRNEKGHTMKIIPKFEYTDRNENLNKIKTKIDSLKEEIEIKENLIKLLETIAATYKEHPSNQYIRNNLAKIGKIIEKEESVEEKLRKKIDLLEKKVLNALNEKFKIELTLDVNKIDLSGKNFQNYDLRLLCAISFKNLEELNLSNNRISNLDGIKDFDCPNLKHLNLNSNRINDISPIKNINSSNLKSINLSFNVIENVKAFKEIMEKNPKLSEIDLRNNINIINNVDVFKNIPTHIKIIELDNNKEEIKKDFEEIKNILKNNSNFLIIEYRKKDSPEIKLFGEEFVNKNKDNCKIIIEKIERDLIPFYKLNTSENIKVKLIITKQLEDMSYMFSGCESLVSLEGLSDWETEKVNNMEYMFSGCSSLKSLEGLSDWETEKVNNMDSMFFGCSSLKSLDGISFWKTNNVKSMKYMFFSCSSLTSLEGISSWNTQNVENMENMFEKCFALSSLKGLSKWKTGKVQNMKNIFYKCKSLLSLEEISNWNTENVVNMEYMFNECSSLSDLKGLSNWKTEKVTNIKYMFGGCSSLSSLNGLSKWNTEKVKNMEYIFAGCSKLLNLDELSEWNTAKITDMMCIFSKCSSLSSLEGISNWQTENVTFEKSLPLSSKKYL